MGESGENTQTESERCQSGESEFLGSNSVTARIESTKAQHIPEVIARQWNLPVKVTFKYGRSFLISSLGTLALASAVLSVASSSSIMVFFGINRTRE